MVYVWCALSATRITGPIWFYETINSHRFVTYILTPFFEHVSGYSDLQEKFIKQTNM
jgi:hypothetical protein